MELVAVLHGQLGEAGKSRSWMQRVISAMRVGTTDSARNRSRALVSTLARMPTVLPVSFFSALTTRMRTRSSGQCDSGPLAGRCCPSHQSALPSATPQSRHTGSGRRCLSPGEPLLRGHSPRRRHGPRCRLGRHSPPPEARPAAVGKLFTDATCTLQLRLEAVGPHPMRSSASGPGGGSPVGRPGAAAAPRPPPGHSAKSGPR